MRTASDVVRGRQLVSGDEREDFVGDAEECVGLRLLAQDGEAGLELGRLDVGDEAPLEAGAQAVLQAGDGLGRRLEPARAGGRTI